MLRNTVWGCLFVAAVAFWGVAVAADEPTLHQVYQAAEAGRMPEALSMMDVVLSHHPNSAKAHYVEAELLAKQGRLSSAAAELHTAQRLAPSLPFTNAQAVHSLEQRIAGSHPAYAGAGGARSRSGFPVSMVLMGVLLIAAIIFFVRATRRRMAPTLLPGSGPAYGPGVAPPYGPAGMGGSAPGIGSGILGGLATGAALGAGMVAGESLMHRFTDGNRGPVSEAFASDSTNGNAVPDDMGGNDFGIPDDSSWDGGATGGDWGDVDSGGDWT